MQARLEAKIAGFGCMSPSIICGCRRWPSAKAQTEISEPNPYRARNRKFESISLQQTVRLSLEFASLHREAWLFLRVCGAGAGGRSAETGMARCQGADLREYLCRAKFQYRSVDEAAAECMAQVKPSAVRCSCQPSGRRECASSLSAVRSRGWRPLRMAWVMSGAR